MKIVFFLMNQKGYDVLMSSLEFSNMIRCVVCSRDNSVHSDYYEEIKSLCAKNKIVFFDKKEYTLNRNDFKIAIGWRWIITPYENVIILHDSLLPRYRGFAPLVSQLINGEEYIGVSAIFASEEYDTGQIIEQEKLRINYPIKIQEAIEKISILYCKIVKNIISKIILSQELTSYKQNESCATYSLWRNMDDYFINWNTDAKNIIRFINAVGFPYLGAHAYLNNDIIIIRDAVEFNDVQIENRENNIGKIIFRKNNKPIVVCKNGLIIILSAIFKSDGTEIFNKIQFRSKFR